jgi:hypothetical protein
MKSILIALGFWIAAGAAVGFAHGSGLLALFDRSHQAMRHDPQWQPISREEYQRRKHVFTLYGAGAGFVVGTMFTVPIAAARARARRLKRAP